MTNTGDRPVQVGSHFHFFEVNRALVFDREKAYGMRLDLLGRHGGPLRAGGRQGGARWSPSAASGKVYGFNGLVMGQLDDPTVRKAAFQRLKAGGFGDTAGK